MASISDIIEKFILDNLGESDEIDISRNALAKLFSCAPSQINYVLETRFTVDRGFVKESKRGGGGFVKISKIPFSDDEAMADLVLKNIGGEISFKRAEQILDNLKREKIITRKEAGLISAALSDTALNSPFSVKDHVRSQIFKSVLVFLLRQKEGE